MWVILPLQIILTNSNTYLGKITKSKIKANSINRERQIQLIPREQLSKWLKLYGFPKIYREGIPLKPFIISSIGLLAKTATTLCRRNGFVCQEVKPLHQAQIKYHCATRISVSN
ncbi:hypothetical protein GWI33_011135 [Rhynchophorus ferrugineus]|uniref:Uncharacterized protein n=1 Tax=Rhynchophorus ferrugineus TaxID=354439 RepID=A0A834MM52_RHYFE|nr:hypothetical protein GWI33_011135 [Rhynchophorus ferrugineus]